MSQRWWIPVAALAVIAIAAFLLHSMQENGDVDVGEPIPVEEPARTPEPEPEPGPGPVEQPEAPSPPSSAEVPPAVTSPGRFDTVLPLARMALKLLQVVVKRSKATNEEILLAIEEATSAGRLLRALAVREAPLAVSKERDLAQLEKAMQKVLLRAYRLERADPGRETNLREAVNIAAVVALGTPWGDDTAEDLAKVVEKSIRYRAIDVTPALLATSFDTLADLGDEKTLAWMIDNYTHSKSSPPKEVEQLVAAHRAMVRFDPAAVSGKLRYEAAMSMVKTYSGVEAQAIQGHRPHAERFWNRIRCGVFAALRHFAGHPTDDAGQELQTMDAFRVWFREHKNPKRPPWTEEVPSDR